MISKSRPSESLCAAFSASPRDLCSSAFICGVIFSVMSDREAVLEANCAFYRAFESLDIEQMAGLWLKEPNIICIHPGWAKLSGWGPVMESWSRIFDSTFEIAFRIGQVDVMISGDIAVAVVQEHITQRGYDGTARSEVMATNVFERVGQKWWLVMHHGSPVLTPPMDQPPIQ
jgi:ketosteroid isomerase-like protein